MNDGRILAKIGERGSLATRQASLLLAIETSIINASPIANDPEFPALILAAGASSRLGRPKALLPLGGRQGILLDRAIDLGRSLSRDVRVVCGAWYPLIRFRCSSQPSAWVRAPDWRDGLAASLTAGLGSLGPRAKGVFVLVADQPLLDVASLRAFGEAARVVPRQPVAADYQGRPGVPAYLPRWLWPEVMALTGDQGAGRLLAEVAATRVDIPGVHDDVDTPEDWYRVMRRLSQTDQSARQFRR